MNTKMNRFLVIDVECKKDFHEVGGRGHFKDLGVSVAGVYDFVEDEFFCFEEDELNKLEELIDKREGIIGFNVRHFDLPVLQPYFSKINLDEKYIIDMLLHVEAALGFRVSLNTLCEGTLGKKKGGHGRDAVPLYKEGKIDELKKYCLQDVQLTKELYDWGNEKGTLTFEDRMGVQREIPANWAESLKKHSDLQELLRDAFSKERKVLISYRSQGSEEVTEREIEIYAIRGSAIEAFCHLRQDRRRFMLDRIVAAEVQEESNSQRALL